MKKIRQLFLSLLAIASVAYSADFSVGKGWNLLGTSTEIAANTTFTNSDVVVSVWSWDNATSSWRFFSPSTSFTDGGAAYAASKGYSPLTKIPAAQGFWVNAATAFAVSNNSIVTKTTQVNTTTSISSTTTTTLTSSGAVIPTAVMLGESQAELVTTINLNVASGYFGKDILFYNLVAKGDLNGDGYDDLVIGLFRHTTIPSYSGREYDPSGSIKPVILFYDANIDSYKINEQLHGLDPVTQYRRYI